MNTNQKIALASIAGFIVGDKLARFRLRRIVKDTQISLEKALTLWAYVRKTGEVLQDDELTDREKGAILNEYTKFIEMVI